MMAFLFFQMFVFFCFHLLFLTSLSNYVIHVFYGLCSIQYTDRKRIYIKNERNVFNVFPLIFIAIIKSHSTLHWLLLILLTTNTLLKMCWNVQSINSLIHKSNKDNLFHFLICLSLLYNTESSHVNLTKKNWCTKLFLD